MTAEENTGLIWVDTVDGTWGDADVLRFIAIEHSVVDDLEGMTDGERCTSGSKYGHSLIDERQDAFDQGENSGREWEDPAVTEMAANLDSLRIAVTGMLERLDIDGTCQLCEMGFNFHSVDCVIHPVNNALDRIDY